MVLVVGLEEGEAGVGLKAKDDVEDTGDFPGGWGYISRPVDDG